MKISEIYSATISIAAMATLAACSTPKVQPVEPIDWTNNACESPAYKDILGNYTGQINYRDTDSRLCRWDAQIAIYGVSMVSDCSLSGTVNASIAEQSTDSDDQSFACADINEQVKFVVGLSDSDLNLSGPSSVIVHLENELVVAAAPGKMVVNPVVQYESLTVENGTLTNDSGSVLTRQ